MNEIIRDQSLVAFKGALPGPVTGFAAAMFAQGVSIIQENLGVNGLVSVLGFDRMASDTDRVGPASAEASQRAT